MFRLEGKKALITGANTGIGEAIANLLAEAGADIAVAIQPGTDPSRVLGYIQGLGRRAKVFEADLNDIDAIHRLAEQANAWLGGLHILGNIAGIGVGGPILNMTLADWDKTLNINTRAVYFMAQAAARLMKDQGGGKIINIASVNAFRGFTDGSLYNLSKAAVVSMTQTMAAEWAPYHINVNAIAPGWIDTNMTMGMPDGRKKWVLDNVPMARRGQPSEIAPMALFLASAASDYVTGATHAVEGGFLNAGMWGDIGWMPAPRST
ncbi:MAG: SDR family oxidoreductase [Anaerolineales bacterium]|nr:SDR family oxidoreductase [Anaerolineales bacterium]